MTNVLDLDSALSISWKINEDQLFEKTFLLQRFIGSMWFTQDSIRQLSGNFLDETVDPLNTINDYRLFSPNECGADYTSRIHRNILLRVDDNDEQRASFRWNPYDDWINGVEEYEIYLSVDGDSLQMVGATSDTRFTFMNDSLGFDYCFRVKAIENGGNNSFSWSNAACALFTPPLYAYNVITPNQDDKNESFVIDNIDKYPNSRLVIYNRWGSKVLDRVGYQNDWNGRDVSSGVYFYILELNEPRVSTKSINGQISVLKR